MLKIRFQRVGRKNSPHFRLVLTESTAAGKKNAKEILGWKDPIKHQEHIEAERVKYWLSVGAQASGTAHNFLVKNGVISGPKITVHKKSKKAMEVTKAETTIDAKTENAVTDAASATTPEVKPTVENTESQPVAEKTTQETTPATA